MNADRKGKRSGWLKWPVRTMVLVAVLLLGPLGVLAFGNLDLDTPWRQASRASSGQAPNPLQETAALVLVYGARAHGWRGAFAIHSWIATKRLDDAQYTIYQATAWSHPVVLAQRGPPDLLWYGSQPELLLERRGPGVDALIERIEAAVAVYPYANEYRAWPGPNSNTFTAFVARQVPELGLDLPSHSRSARITCRDGPGGSGCPAAPAGKVSVYRIVWGLAWPGRRGLS